MRCQSDSDHGTVAIRGMGKHRDANGKLVVMLLKPCPMQALDPLFNSGSGQLHDPKRLYF